MKIGVVVRLRIDGVLFDAFDVPKGIQEEVLSRIKVMGRMNIAEKRLPQDGRATVQMGDRLVDLRIASLPTSCGERIVLRLLDKSARLYSLGELGMDAASMRTFGGLIQLEHGLILVTGPTGSGKSTTLYAALKEINTTDRNVLTLEDPIEYQLPGISQTQVSEKKGMTFARGSAKRLASRSRHHHDRRDSGPRDGCHGDSVGPDRPPRLLDAPHQRRCQRRNAASRSGDRALFGGQFFGCCLGAAIGATNLQGMRRTVCSVRRRPHAAGPEPIRNRRHSAMAGPRLRGVSSERL